MSEIMSAKAEKTRQILLDAVERAKREQIFKALNKAYDTVIACSEHIGMNRDEFKRHFGGIAEDYKMAKLRYEVAQDRCNKVSRNYLAKEN